jgi:hypothetical protein
MAKGYSQVEGLGFGETYAPVAFYIVYLFSKYLMYCLSIVVFLVLFS